MKLVVVSHKQGWPDADAPSGYVTDGGFPYHMQAVSNLFDETEVVMPIAMAPSPPGTGALRGHRLRILPLVPPAQGGGRRKSLVKVLPANLGRIWKAVQQADAVHVPVPGDIGMMGILVALIQRKRLFVRHCGNWLVQRSPAEHLLKFIMERFAGGRNVMLATGGGVAPPSAKNPAIKWIFSSGLTRADLKKYGAPRTQLPKQPRLVIACRQERNKGTHLVIESLPDVMQAFPGVHLEVVGDGRALPDLKQQAEALGVADHVTFHGRLPHKGVLERMQAADLFCYPTQSPEGFPKVVLEALASGLPVITTAVSVLPHLIGDRSGHILDEVTPAAMATAIRHCLADETRYVRMSQQAVETAAQYSLEAWEETIGGYLEAAWGPLRSDG